MMDGLGRAWKTEELRTKSFADLHTLWYILLKEKNVLATQEVERKRINIQYIDVDLMGERKFRVRPSLSNSAKQSKLIFDEIVSKVDGADQARTQ